MNKQSFKPQWEMQRLRVGIALRAIEAVPVDKLDSHPVAGMRTPKELMVHAFQFMRSAMDGIAKGELPSPDENAIVASLTDRAQLLAWMRDCWTKADATFSTLTDAQLAGTVKTSWGENYPGSVVFGFVPDEFLHHRGQLYAYLRVFGIEPPMLWDFEHNALEYQPAHATS